MPASSIGAVAIWTSVDLPGLGDQLLGRVIEQELLARLPGWRMTLHAPLGWERPSVTDGGVVAEPLGERSPNRVAELTAATNLSVVCPSFSLGDTEHYGADAYFTDGLGDVAHPVLPFAVRVTDSVPLLARAPMISVRDAVSRDRLVAAGLDVTVVPHPGLLLERIVDFDTLPVRAQQLRQLGLLPDGDFVVGDPADAVVVPDDVVLEDRLAILAAARSVIATDEHVAAVCTALGVPWVLVDPDGTQRPAVLEFGTADQITDSAANLPAPLVATAPKAAVAAAFDGLAEFAEQHSGADLDRRVNAVAGENAALRHAHWQLRQRMLVERQRLAEPLADAWRERDDAVAEVAHLRTANEELSRHNGELAARLARLEQELAAWQNTKLVRWTKPLREVYGKARG